MRQNLFERIRSDAAEVCAKARHVAIATGNLEAYAATLDTTALKTPAHDPASHYLGHGDDTALFFVVLDSINFGSGYFPHLDKLPGRSGYFTVATRLAERFSRQGPFRVDEMLGLSAGDIAAVLHQNPDNRVVMELMGLFARALRDLGVLLRANFHDSAMELTASAEQSAEKLCRILGQMELFRDEQPYLGKTVAFYKRAQLTAADLSVAFGNQGIGFFHDLDRLTVFADNLVPHVLRLDGVLLVDPDVVARIAAGELIEKDSTIEVELRAATVHAVELLTAAFQAQGIAVTPLELDFLLWNRGQQPQYKAVPRHRCRTWFY